MNLGTATLLGLLFVCSPAYSGEAKNSLGAFSPANLKTQYRYDDKTIAGDRLNQHIHRRKAELDGCAAVINGQRGEYGSYYRVPSGSVAIELNLDKEGRATQTRVAQDNLPDGKVADCVHRFAKNLKIDVEGLKDPQIKKFLVLYLKCESSAEETTVTTRCTGTSQLYDKIAK